MGSGRVMGVGVSLLSSLVLAAAALPARAVASSAPGVPGMPDGAPPAATEPEPTLPAPSGWPFPESFPRTSGAGRLDRGASFWTDFLYDDHGAVGVPTGTLENGQVSSLAPAKGTYVYPSGPAHGNGADIFRAAVGLDATATYWRVDWNTLADPSIPIAEWTFDTDESAATGASIWPAGAGVRSPGIEKALVVSSHGARLLDALTGQVIATFPTTVDMQARSFIVRIPRSTLPVGGAWRIRLAAGLANADGTAFAPVSAADGALPGEPAIYNVTFRSYQQESELVCPPGVSPPQGHVPTTQCGNFWMDNDQAQTLATGDVSKYSLVVQWAALAAGQSTPEPLVYGYSNRWYVSRLNLGPGVVPNASNQPTGDLRPNYLGRVQPYAVYVPRSYNPARPAPLTWILHSLGANLNQYGGVAPSQLQEECEARDSICATTEGYGPDGWYFDEAEVDFWQVWRALADSYALDPDATVISGYSMGGFASYKLALEYPDLFAEAMPLEGPPGCGARIAEGLGAPAAAGHCGNDGDTTPLLVNARWLPYVMTYGVIDELVPFTSGLQQVQAIDKLGYRYYAVLYPTEDHMVFAVQNDFLPATSQLGSPRRVIDPAHVTYSWYPDLARSDFGIGPTGAYWVRGLSARDSKPGKIATLDVRSYELPDPSVTPERSTSALPEFHPTPAAVRKLTWKLGPAPALQAKLTIELTDVSSLGIDTARAKFSCGTIDARSDGPATVRLLRLSRGARVEVAGRTVAVAGSDGTAAFSIPVGSSTATVFCAKSSRKPGSHHHHKKGSSPTTGKSRSSDKGTGTGAGSSSGGESAESSGTLPFTGLALGGVLAAGLALFAGGAAIRRVRG